MTAPTPVVNDAHATTSQLLARAADDYAQARDAARAKEAQGGGTRQGIFPGGGAH
jgi:hypothetical protein